MSVGGVRYNFDLHLVAAAAGSVTTRASVAIAADVNPSNDSAAATTIVGSDAVADLALSTAHSAIRFTANAIELDFTNTVVNNGPSPASNVVISNPLPAGATTVNASCKGTPVVCTTGTSTLAPGERFTSTLTFRVPTTAASLVNEATVSAATADPVGGNNSASATASTTGISASVALADVYGNARPLSSAAPPGAPLLYFLSLSDSKYGRPTVSVALPAGSAITSPSAGNGVTIDGTTITLSLFSRVAIAVTAPTAPGHYTATVTIANRTVPPVMIPLDVVAGAQPPPATDLAVLVQPPAVAPPLEVASYVASIVNRGPMPASNVRLAFMLPPGTTLDRIDAADLTCNASASPIVCTAPSLANGDTLDATFAVRVGDVALGGALAASASVTSDTLDTDAGNDSATGAAVVAWPTELAIRIDPPDIAVAPGAQFTETITVTNVGKAALKVMQVGDSLAHGALQVISQTSPSATCGGKTVLCTAPSLAPGAQIVVTAVLKAPQSGSVTHYGYALSYGPDFGVQNFIKPLTVVVTPHPWHRAAGH